MRLSILTLAWFPVKPGPLKLLHCFLIAPLVHSSFGLQFWQQRRGLCLVFGLRCKISSYDQILTTEPLGGCISSHDKKKKKWNSMARKVEWAWTLDHHIFCTWIFCPESLKPSESLNSVIQMIHIPLAYNMFLDININSHLLLKYRGKQRQH